MMPSLRHIVTFVAAVTVSLAAFGQDKQTCFPVTPVTDLPFQGGEHIKLQFHYKWGVINADVAKFDFWAAETTEGSVPVFHLEGSGKTHKMVSSFFHLQYKFDSWVDMATFRPIRASREAWENKYSAVGTQAFDWNTRTLFARKDSSRGFHKSDKIEIADCTFDILSVLYQLRRVDVSALQSGEYMSVRMVIDNEIFPVTLKYLGKSSIYIKGVGMVRAVKFACSVVEGDLFDNSTDDAYIWFSDDADRLPVYVKAELKFGTVVGRIVSWDGIKNGFTSLSR